MTENFSSKKNWVSHVWGLVEKCRRGFTTLQPIPKEIYWMTQDQTQHKNRELSQSSSSYYSEKENNTHTSTRTRKKEKKRRRKKFLAQNTRFNNNSNNTNSLVVV